MAESEEIDITDGEDETDIIEDIEKDSIKRFTGEFHNAEQIDTYKVRIDFSEMDTVAFSLVRTGFTNVTMILYNESGEKVIAKSVTDKQAKTWYYLNKPDNYEEPCEYTIIVNPVEYAGKSSNYCISVGNKENVEEVLGGIENTVPLESYREVQNNFVSLTYTPNKEECWFRFTQEIDTTITILSKSNDIRFKVVNPVNGEDVFRSIDAPNSHKTKFVGNSWTCAEKIKNESNLVAGTEYYLVIYNINPNEDNALDTRNILVAVGKPVMGAGTTKLYPNRNVRMRTNAYTTVNFNIHDTNIPTTAQIDTIRVGGTLARNVDTWRVLPPNKKSWSLSASKNLNINMNFTKDSTLNAYVQGDWQVGFRAATNATTTSFTPYYSISYYYEYGD